MLRRLCLASVLAGALAGCGGDGPGYVGTWRPVETDSLGVRYTFFADGTARIILRPTVGEPEAFGARYAVEGDSLLTLSDDQGAERFRVRLRGDSLWLRSPASGRETVWTRM